MSTSPSTRPMADEPDRVREISKWTRRYAQNRTIPVLVGLSFITVVGAGIAGSGYLAQRTYAGGQTVGFAIALFGCLSCGLALAHFPFPLIPEHPRLHLPIAIVGYGALAALARHVYSRVALRKLRALARMDGHGGAAEPEVKGQ